MKTIEVSNCHECPFVEYNVLYVYYGCGLNEEMQIGNFEYNELTGTHKLIGEMPIDSVHHLCPLKSQSVIVKLK